MENIKMIVLDAKQIAELLHDYIATNARALCYDKSIDQTGTYVILEKNQVKMLCSFSKENNFIFNKSELLERLPHTGFRNFIMPNKQVKELLSDNKVLALAQIKLEKEYCYKKMPKNHIRIMTLNEKEISEILIKQIFQYVGDLIGFHTTNYSAGIKINFDGDHSKLIYYFSDRVLDIDISKLTLLNFNSISSYGFKFMELTDCELKKLLHEN